jgi:hypothetical protein
MPALLNQRVVNILGRELNIYGDATARAFLPFQLNQQLFLSIAGTMKLLLPIPLLAGLAASSPLEARQASFSGFAGTNAYWLPFLTNDADITTAFNA